MESLFLKLRIIYIANIFVAGTVGFLSFFKPESALVSVFSKAYPYSDVVRLVGALWIGIAILSLLGLFFPLKMVPVLLLQLIYKGLWLLLVFLPALNTQQNQPYGMAVFFLIWVLILPFVIPFQQLFAQQ